MIFYLAGKHKPYGFLLLSTTLLFHDKPRDDPIQDYCTTAKNPLQIMKLKEEAKGTYVTNH